MACALRPVTLTRSRALELEFGHFLTTFGVRDALWSGTSIWTATSPCAAPVALAFEWSEVSHQVLALADVLGVMSNLRPSDEEGRLLLEDRRLQVLAVVVHRLEWQEVVRQHLSCSAVQGSQVISARDLNNVWSDA